MPHSDISHIIPLPYFVHNIYHHLTCMLYLLTYLLSMFPPLGYKLF